MEKTRPDARRWSRALAGELDFRQAQPGVTRDEKPSEESWGLAVGALALLALLALLINGRLEPSPVRPADAPLAEFSAARAEQVASRLLEEGTPHPTGSSAQARVRARLLRELEQLGLTPSVQQGVACANDGICAELHNVLAEVPGSGGPTLTLLAAHYDSVPAGPGAGDDGQGTASLLELARALLAQPTRGGVQLLFTDGEELGLLGARLFAAEHPLAAKLQVALNLEARGSRGPSLMFETTTGSGWLVQHYARAPHPVASSLFGAVYRNMPNDTDLTVFAERGLQGLNFAFVGGVEHYHTPRDTLQQLDWRSVQHQGSAVLATLRASNAEVAPAGRELVFFDVLGGLLVTLPEPLMLPAASLALLALGWTLRAELRRRRGYARDLGRAAVALLAAWLLPVLATILLGLVLTLLGALPFPIIATPLPLLLSIFVLVAAGQAFALWLTPSREQRRALADVTWLGWLSVGLVLSLVLPLASYLAVLPGVVAALVRLGLRPHTPPVLVSAARLGCALVAALLWLPVLLLLPSSLGLAVPAALTFAAAFAFSPFLPLLGPLLSGFRVRLALWAGGAALGLAQLALAPYSLEVPQRLSLGLEVDASGAAHWLAEGDSGPLPASLRAAAAFSSRPSHPHPWPGPSYGENLMYAADAPAPQLPLPQPRLERHGSVLRLELQAPADLWAVGLRLAPSPRLLHTRWHGRPLQPSFDGGAQSVLLVPAENRSISLELEFDAAPPEELDVLAIALGLPEPGRNLQIARGALAVTSGFGDLTVLHLPARVTPGSP